ncbi:non-homologous end-joining factor 1 isoform X2 [Carcharodon carcharias]|uniref:non-homologous end-joining factor 1 isoform X2 n=1 Tax=Carcharodon carcharias TaxID=13397 RepID=UPI001B7E82B4|nr:non-homologous end-joining factor 1 isoform X2 [Carcharodon carcharias]
MAEVAKLADDLLAQPWISVHIGDSPFLLKASFGDAAYKLMLSDFDSVWWEEMNSDGLEQRAQELNKRLKAPVSAFCRHLREAVAPLLRGGSGDPLPGFSCERAQNLISVGLRTELSGVPFYWTFHCTEAPLSMVSCHMICPLLNMMQALHRQTRDLMLLLERKDAEILDYKENGATLSRDRLETETFNAEEFKDRFLAEERRTIGILSPVSKKHKTYLQSNQKKNWPSQLLQRVQKLKNRHSIVFILQLREILFLPSRSRRKRKAKEFLVDFKNGLF